MAGFDDLVPAAMPYLATETLLAAAGSSWEWSYEFLDDAGDPVDLTGVTAVCEIRTSIGGSVVLAPTVSFPAVGQVKVTAAPGETAAVPPGRYVHEVELTNASSRKVKVVGGGDSHVIVKPEVTS